MNHCHRRILAATAGNAAIVLGEAAAGHFSASLGLSADAAHNLADQTGLMLLCLAFAGSAPRSLRLQRVANLLNAGGLLLLSAFIAWQALARLRAPGAVAAEVSLIGGLLAAAGNWGVAALLSVPARGNAAVRLAWLHNRGDAVASLATAASGALVLLTGASVFDALLALLLAAWLAVSVVRELLHSHAELLAPQPLRCEHGKRG